MNATEVIQQNAELAAELLGCTRLSFEGGTFVWRDNAADKITTDHVRAAREKYIGTNNKRRRRYHAILTPLVFKRLPKKYDSLKQEWSIGDKNLLATDQATPIEVLAALVLAAKEDA